MHIVFQKQDVAALAKSFELDASLQEEILWIRDDYSVGPLKSNDPLGELQLRKEWWQQVLDEDISLTDPEGINNQLLIHNIRKVMESNEEEKITMWVSPNVRDVCGYYRILHEFKQFSGRLLVIHLNNLPFINEKGSIFYPEYLFEIPAKEFLKAKKLAREVTEAEFELDTDEWASVCRQNKTVRKLQGAKKISSHADDVFDKDILQLISGDFLRASKLINIFFSKSKEQISQDYILWRLHKLVEKGTLMVKGDIRNMKEFEVKKRSNETAEEFLK